MRNQGLFQKLEKKSGYAKLPGLHPKKRLGLYYKPENNPGAKPENKSRFAGPEIFLGFKTGLDFSKH